MDGCGWQRATRAAKVKELAAFQTAADLADLVVGEGRQVAVLVVQCDVRRSAPAVGISPTTLPMLVTQIAA
jgi:hypothetical protein